MTKEDIWNLFVKTGDISYYLRYKEMMNKGLDKIGDNESKGNNN